VKKPSKKILAYSALVAVSLLFMLWLAGLLEFGRIAPGTVAREVPPPKGRILTVQEVEIPLDLTIVAQVMSKTLTRISAQVPGRVKAVLVDAGQRVRLGEPLVYLQGPEYRARVRQAQAGVRQARAQLTQVAADYERYRRLLREGAVSPREFEALEAKYQAARAALAQARARVKEAAVFKDYTLLRAPLAGVVAERRVAVGDLAQPGQPLITLYAPDTLQIEGEVNETYRDKLKIGLPVRFEVPAAQLTGEATLAEIFPISAAASRTFKVRTGILALPRGQEGEAAPVPSLVPGMYARLYVPVGRTRRLLIPEAAVQRVGQLSMVEVLEKGRLIRRQVKLGRRIGKQVEVLAGLAAGEQIVVP